MQAPYFLFESKDGARQSVRKEESEEKDLMQIANICGLWNMSKNIGSIITAQGMSIDYTMK